MPMTNPELERERGEQEEFSEWLIGYRARHKLDIHALGVRDAWKASQQSTLRRVRAALVANGEQQALAAIEREFGGVEC